MSTHQYLPFLEQELTPSRLTHSLGVMQVMGELADVYDLDRELAETIGILHDAGKDFSPKRVKQLVAEGNIQARCACEENYLYYFHGPVGAYFVKTALGITDSLILDAITSHSYCGDCGDGTHFNHPICWCLRFADILEPNRRFAESVILQRGAERLRGLAYTGKMEAGAWVLTGCLDEFFEGKGIPVHPNITRAHAELAVRLTPEERRIGWEGLR